MFFIFHTSVLPMSESTGPHASSDEVEQFYHRLQTRTANCKKLIDDYLAIIVRNIVCIDQIIKNQQLKQQYFRYVQCHYQSIHQMFIQLSTQDNGINKQNIRELKCRFHFAAMLQQSETADIIHHLLSNHPHNQ